MPSNVKPLRLKQTFPPIIWIFTEGEGDEMESRLPFKILSTLQMHGVKQEVFDLWYYCSFICCYLLLVQISELYSGGFLIQ